MGLLNSLVPRLHSSTNLYKYWPIVKLENFTEFHQVLQHVFPVQMASISLEKSLVESVASKTPRSILYWITGSFPCRSAHHKRRRTRNLGGLRQFFPNEYGEIRTESFCSSRGAAAPPVTLSRTPMVHIGARTPNSPQPTRRFGVPNACGPLGRCTVCPRLAWP